MCRYFAELLRAFCDWLTRHADAFAAAIIGLRESSKLPLPLVQSAPTFNARFHEPTRITVPNGISIGSAVFAGLKSVPNRPSDSRSSERPTMLLRV